MDKLLEPFKKDDLRRSKQNNMAVQNALYNFGSSSSSTPSSPPQTPSSVQSFNQPSQHQQRQPQHKKSSEITSLKPANQYQTPRVTTISTAAAAAASAATSSPPPRYSQINRKSTAAQVTAKPTPFVLASSPTPSSSSSNLNNNDEIFKGSHSSNFYSNRNSNDDDDDYKRSSITNSAAAKSRHRSRGRTHYRGTPSSISGFTATTTTTTSTTTHRPLVASSIQNYTTFAPFTTTPSPFKFTYSSTIRSNSPAAVQLSNVGNNYQQNQINSTPLGPLQQQYRQTNYNSNNNNNNFINFKATSSATPTPSFITTTPPIITTLRNSFRPNSFNLITTTPSTFAAVPLQRQVVSVPTPFNSNHLTNNNANGKFLINANSNNNKIQYNSNNLFASNATNQQQRTFDNHNLINNYQTTSPFSNQRIVVENHLPVNNTILRPAQSIANHYFPQNSVAATNGNSNNLLRNSSFYQPNFGSSAAAAIALTTTTTTTTQSPITRNGFAGERPNFNQQDLLNQFNQQQKSTVTANRQPEAKDYRLQLHYDINDYLTTDKFTARAYSPTSEQYRAAQTFSSTPSQPAAVQFFTTTTTSPKSNAKFDAHNQYQTQQDRPSAYTAQNSVFKFNNSPINTTPQSVLARQQQQSNQNNNNDANNNYNFNGNSANNISPASTKKFSTLVPKGNYAPTTYKPLNYFNVAKQINDNLSTPAKLRTDTIDRFASASSITTTTSTSTTSRTVPIQPIFNRGADFAHFNFADSTTTSANKPAAANGQFQPLLIKPTANISGIDENDGQYHPELYEKDFARYKIKNRKKQQQHRNQEHRQQQQTQHRQQLHKQQNNNFGKSQNDFGLSSNKYQQQQQQQFNSRGTQKNFNNNGGGNGASSIEEEFLNTAHSQNIAASGNELWAHAKNAAAANSASSSAAIKSKQSYNVPTKVPTIATTAKTITTTTPPPPPIKTAPFASSPKDDKDASYDYAYYDSGNDTPHDYSDIELDFTKTRKQ